MNYALKSGYFGNSPWYFDGTGFPRGDSQRTGWYVGDPDADCAGPFASKQAAATSAIKAERDAALGALADICAALPNIRTAKIMSRLGHLPTDKQRRLIEARIAAHEVLIKAGRIA